MQRPLESCSIEIAGVRIDVAIRRNPRARRLILRLGPTPGPVTLVTPRFISQARALRFVEEHARWLGEKLAGRPTPVDFSHGAEIPFRGHMHRLISKPQARGAVLCASNEIHVPGGQLHLARRLTDWLKREARAAITGAVAEHAAAFERAPARITIRDQKSRWGSCSPNGNMSFSWRLILAPPEILDYVCAHETAHLAQMNHSGKFWQLVQSRIADPDSAEGWLARHGAGLHRYGFICRAAPAKSATPDHQPAD